MTSRNESEGGGEFLFAAALAAVVRHWLAAGSGGRAREQATAAWAAGVLVGCCGSGSMESVTTALAKPGPEQERIERAWRLGMAIAKAGAAGGEAGASARRLQRPQRALAGPVDAAAVLARREAAAVAAARALADNQGRQHEQPLAVGRAGVV